MRVVQALHWLKDTLGSDRDRILQRLDKSLSEPAHGPAIRQDLIEGFAVLPAWMRELLRELPSFDPLATRHVAPRERSPDLQPAEPVVRYEHAASGEMLHIDTKKFWRLSLCPRCSEMLRRTASAPACQQQVEVELFGAGLVEQPGAN